LAGAALGSVAAAPYGYGGYGYGNPYGYGYGVPPVVYSEPVAPIVIPVNSYNDATALAYANPGYVTSFVPASNNLGVPGSNSNVMMSPRRY
jgi:hypothetical protein